MPCAKGFYCPDPRLVAKVREPSLLVQERLLDIYSYYSVINLLVTANVICFKMFSNPPVPCPAGMYSLGGRFENCTACPAGNACPDPAGAPVACTGGIHLFLIGY